MISTFRYLAKATGVALIVVSLAMLPTVAVSVIYKEFTIAVDFIKVLVVAFIIGIILYKSITHSFDRLRISDGLLMVTWGWIIASLAGSLPFALSGCFDSYIDAFFESCSGFTTTGATVLSDISSVPQGLIFWRSTTSWLGGIAILLIAIAIFPNLGLSGQSIISTETDGPVLERPTPRRRNLARTLIRLYTILTVCEVILLCLCGMGLFDSLIHSFGSVSTGGFSSYNDDFCSVNSIPIKVIVTFFMVVCGVNFNLYYLSFRRGPGVIFRDSEFRLYSFFVLAPAAIIAIGLLAKGHDGSIGNTIINSLFQSASMLTTTGYVASDYDYWPQICQIILLTLMFIGACSSSTGGGLKVIRFVIIAKLLRHGIAMRLHTRYYEAIKANKRSIAPDKVSGVCNYVFLYILIVLGTTIAVSFECTDMTTAFTAVVTCIGNIGSCFGAAGPEGYFADFSTFSKILFSALMIAGRLELYTFFILFSPNYWTQRY